MRKFKSFIPLVLMTFVLSVTITSCSNDDADNVSSALQSEICGTWRLTSIVNDDGTLTDLTTFRGEYLFKPTYAKFNSDGTYSGWGYFGNGSGTYQVKGYTVYTYVDGKEYLKYQIINVSETPANSKSG